MLPPGLTQGEPLVAPSSRKEAIHKGYDSYIKGRERSKQQLRQEVFKRESHRLHLELARQLRADSGKNGRPFLTAGSEYISLSPDGLRLASELATEAVLEWERNNRELTQSEWARKEGLPIAEGISSPNATGILAAYVGREQPAYRRPSVEEIVRIARARAARRGSGYYGGTGRTARERRIRELERVVGAERRSPAKQREIRQMIANVRDYRGVEYR